MNYLQHVATGLHVLFGGDRAVAGNDLCLRVSDLEQSFEGHVHAADPAASGVVDHRVGLVKEQVAGLEDVVAREEQVDIVVGMGHRNINVPDLLLAELHLAAFGEGLIGKAFGGKCFGGAAESFRDNSLA